VPVLTQRSAGINTFLVAGGSSPFDFHALMKTYMNDLVYELNVGTCKDLIRHATPTIVKLAKMDTEAVGSHFEH
jgi:hypothetical protein